MGASMRVTAYLLALACMLASPASVAQSYPSKPIRMIVPYSAGGTADLLGRGIAQLMSEALGQQVVIENRTGAGGGIGADLVAKSKPDGYTLLMGTIATHAINPNLYAKLPYDAVEDFAPVALVATLPNLLVVHPSVPAKTVKELVALAKARPGELAFASAGNGTTHHLCGELFSKLTGVQMVHVPYKGNAPAVSDLVGGQVQLMFDNIPISLQQVRAGKLRPLAVTGLKRSPALPEVPTLDEAALPGFAVTSWFALFAPAGTPASIVTILNRETIKALTDEKLHKRLADQGIEPGGGTPARLAELLRSELAMWKKIVVDSGARVE
jgi:tripartite-type tricarboxylate transporter receptor subunit TctC